MTVYQLPEEPEGPLWEPDGHKWVRGGGGYWEDSDGLHLSWYGLMSSRVQLTDEPPEPPLGEVRWHNMDPNKFAVRSRSRKVDGARLWRGDCAESLSESLVDEWYTRTEPAPADVEGTDWRCTGCACQWLGDDDPQGAECDYCGGAFEAVNQ